jgi:hypothetical protein
MQRIGFEKCFVKECFRLRGFVRFIWSDKGPDPPLPPFLLSLICIGSIRHLIKTHLGFEERLSSIFD